MFIPSAQNPSPMAAALPFSAALAALYPRPGCEDLLPQYALGIMAGVQASLWDVLSALAVRLRVQSTIGAGGFRTLCRQDSLLEDVTEFCIGEPFRYHVALVHAPDEVTEAGEPVISQLLLTALDADDGIMNPFDAAPQHPVPLEKLPAGQWKGMLADLNDPFLFSPDNAPRHLAGPRPRCKPIQALYALRALCDVLIHIGYGERIAARAREVSSYPLSDKGLRGHSHLLRAGLEEAWATGGCATVRTINALESASLQLNALRLDHAWRTRLSRFHDQLCEARHDCTMRALAMGTPSTSVYASSFSGRRILNCQDNGECYRLEARNMGNSFELRVWQDSNPEMSRRLCGLFTRHDGRLIPHPKWELEDTPYQFSLQTHGTPNYLIDILLQLEEQSREDLAYLAA